MKYKCIRKCYWKSRLWLEGETVDYVGDDIPHHFEPLKIPKLDELKETDLDDREFLKKALKEIGVPFNNRWKTNKLKEVYVKTVEPGEIRKPKKVTKVKNPFVTEQEK